MAASALKAGLAALIALLALLYVFDSGVALEGMLAKRREEAQASLESLEGEAVPALAAASEP